MVAERKKDRNPMRIRFCARALRICRVQSPNGRLTTRAGPDRASFLRCATNKYRPLDSTRAPQAIQRRQSPANVMNILHGSMSKQVVCGLESILRFLFRQIPPPLKTSPKTHQAKSGASLRSESNQLLARVSNKEKSPPDSPFQ